MSVSTEYESDGMIDGIGLGYDQSWIRGGRAAIMLYPILVSVIHITPARSLSDWKEEGES